MSRRARILLPGVLGGGIADDCLSGIEVMTDVRIKDQFRSYPVGYTGYFYPTYSRLV